MTWLLALALLCILVGAPILCGVTAWYSCRLEHQQHRRDMDAREAVLAVREQQVWKRELELGRRAHDIHTMLNMRQIAIENDTTLLQMAVWEEPA